MISWIKYSALTLLLISSYYVCLSQCRLIEWPADSGLAVKARQEIARLNVARLSKDYRNATSALTWLARHAPRADSNLYTDAELIYGTLITRERNATVKYLYLDSMFLFYGLRERNCDKDFDVAEAKAMARHRYFLKEKPEAVRKELDSLVKARGTAASNRLIIAYMESVSAEYRKYNKLDDNDILKYYNTAMHIAELKRRGARRLHQPEQPVMRLMDDIDAILFSMIVVDCPFVQKILGPRFRAYPDDLMLARKIISLMLQNQCVDDPLWLQAGERLYASQDKHEFSLAKSIGLRYFSVMNYTKARPFLEDAAEIAPTNRDKAEMLLLVGRIQARTDKEKARMLFRSALLADKDNKEAFERIGDLYFNSEKSCGGTGQITPLLIYMLAADYYQRAGNGQKLTMAREKFPTKLELKEWGYQEGREASVECWIQETTTIKTKN